MWREKLFVGKMVKIWDFMGHIIGGWGSDIWVCLGNYWGMGIKYWGDVSPVDIRCIPLYLTELP